MSAKKRVSIVPESIATNTSYPIYDLDQSIGSIQGGGVSTGQDPLLAMEMEETNQAIKELRELQAEKKRSQLMARIKKEKEQIEMGQEEDGTWSPKGLPNLSVRDVQEVSKMSPEEQQKFVQTYQMVASMSRMAMPAGQQNPILTMMAATGGFGGGNKGITAKDIMDIGGMFSTIYNGAGRGDSEMTSKLLLNLMSNTLPQWQNSAIQNMQMAYQAQISQLQQNQADPLRDLEYGKKLAETMGYKPVSANSEIEKLRLDMEDRWKARDFDLRTNELQYSRNLGTIREILNNPVLTDLVKGITRGFGGAALGAQPPVSVNALTDAASQKPAVPGTQGTLIKYVCPNPQCGAEIIAPSTETVVTCTQCGGIYNVDPQASIRNATKGMGK